PACSNPVADPARRTQLSIIDELSMFAHRNVHLTSGAWYVLTRRDPSGQHLSRINYLLIVNGFGQAVGKRVSAEVAPEISATTQYFPIPINLNVIPQLEAQLVQVFVAIFLLKLFASDSLLSCLHPNKLFVADWRKLVVPTYRCAKTHA